MKVFITWFTKYADADKFCDGKEFFEYRLCTVVPISPDRFEVWETINQQSLTF